jgi:hypothetical protein
MTSANPILFRSSLYKWHTRGSGPRRVHLRGYIWDIWNRSVEIVRCPILLLDGGIALETVNQIRRTSNLCNYNHYHPDRSLELFRT